MFINIHKNKMNKFTIPSPKTFSSIFNGEFSTAQTAHSTIAQNNAFGRVQHIRLCRTTPVDGEFLNYICI
jgi:hypothetical protein